MYYLRNTQSSVSVTTATSSPALGVSESNHPRDAKLHTEIRAVLELYEAHSHKIYFSGPLVRKCERNPNNQRVIDEGWVEIWAQLGGNCLSIWIVKEIEAASKEGREVPPSYMNITDSFTQILGAVTAPATSLSRPKRYSNVLTLTTAGSNLHLFSCPDTPSLVSWTTAVRLAAWERSKLEEIYTASLLRTTLPAADAPTTLIDRKLEGWARVRLSGQTEWHKVWLVVQAGVADYDPDRQSPPAPSPAPATPIAIPVTTKKKRISNIFSLQTTSTNLPSVPARLLSMHDSPKAKQKKKPPLFSMSTVCQAYAVYPERPELIEASSLIKVAGAAAGFKDGWDNWRGKGEDAFVLILPDGGSAEMLKWIVALHDAFELYGRPKEWNWDHRNPVSLLFGYPAEPQKAELFLDRPIAETIDPREDRVTKNYASFKRLLKKHKFPSQ